MVPFYKGHEAFSFQFFFFRHYKNHYDPDSRVITDIIKLKL